jgi:uncharacterized membrane protein
MFNSVGLKVAICSFVIGVSILFLYLITGIEIFMMFGFWYLFLAVIFNIITLFYLIIDGFFDRANAIVNAYTALVILLNIPIAWLCAYIGFDY